MEIDFSTILMTWVNFGIIVLILKHFFWDKIKGIIEERQDAIDEKLTKADEDSEKARMYYYKWKNLKDAKEEGEKNHWKNEKQKGDKIYEEIVDNAKTEANALIERANVEIEREKKKLNMKLKNKLLI